MTRPIGQAQGGIEVRPVETKADVDLFWRAAIEAQGGDPAFSPQLLKEIRHVITPLNTPFARANDGRSWIALRAGRPVGRVYAVKNYDHLVAHRDATGQFGFIEAIDDDLVWDALFSTVGDFLRERGLVRISGPFSASVNHECGLLVEGHGTPSTTHTNYAPAYYARQLARLGFSPIKDIVAYEGAIAGARLPARVAAARAKWRDSHLLELRRAEGPDAVLAINDIYNDGWSRNWGSVPVSAEEARFVAELAQPILPRDWTTIAHWRGEPVGALSMAPDFNEIIHDLGGRLFPFGWAKVAWRLKVSGASRVRVPVIGIRRGLIGTRVGAMAAACLLADAVEKARKAGVARIEVSWMLEDNHRVINLVKSLPATRTKTWRIFARGL